MAEESDKQQQERTRELTMLFERWGVEGSSGPVTAELLDSRVNAFLETQHLICLRMERLAESQMEVATKFRELSETLKL